MNYFYVDPEVAGGLGTNTVLDRQVLPPSVTQLHYNFDGWLGDALVQSFPCFVATTKVREGLESIGATGVAFADLEVTASEEFRELYPGRILPRFFWLKVSGSPACDDFGIDTTHRLVVSDRALQVLREAGIDHAEIEAL